MYEKSVTQSNIVRAHWVVMACLLAHLAWVPTVSAEQWFGRDKALHLAVSTALGSSAYGTLWILADHSGDPSWTRLLVASSAALLPGVAKEIYDAGRSGNHFSGADLVWDLIGVSIGAGALYLVERFLVSWRDHSAARRAVRLVGGPISRGAQVALHWPF